MESMLARGAARSLWGLLTVHFTKPVDIWAEYLSNKAHTPELAPNLEEVLPSEKNCTTQLEKEKWIGSNSQIFVFHDFMDRF